MGNPNLTLLNNLIKHLSSLNDKRLNDDLVALKKINPEKFGAMQASWTLFTLYYRHPILRDDEKFKKLCLSAPEARELKLKG